MFVSVSRFSWIRSTDLCWLLHPIMITYPSLQRWKCFSMLCKILREMTLRRYCYVSSLNEYVLYIYDVVASFYINKLWQVLWLKSRTSEVWLERRTNYARSLAVMSMVWATFFWFSNGILITLRCWKGNFQVGYLLGLGDRHPSNLMLDRYRYIFRTILPLVYSVCIMRLLL